MKVLALSAMILLTQAAFADQLTQILMNSDCTPVRGQDGDVTGYNCDGQFFSAHDKKIQDSGIQKTRSVHTQGDVTEQVETERQ